MTHAKEIDPSRLVNYVTNNLHFGYPSEGKSLPDASADFDMMMFNEYFSTWYGKSLDVISGQLDRIARNIHVNRSQFRNGEYANLCTREEIREGLRKW